MKSVCWRSHVKRHVSSILFGDTRVPNLEKDHILLLGYSIFCKEHYLTEFNHQKTRYSHDPRYLTPWESGYYCMVRPCRIFSIDSSPRL